MHKISIEYCAVWNYTDRAISLMVELVKKYEFKVSSVTLIPSDGGAFEIKVDDKLIYSKLATGRDPEKGEVDQLVQNLL